MFMYHGKQLENKHFKCQEGKMKMVLILLLQVTFHSVFLIREDGVGRQYLK